MRKICMNTENKHQQLRERLHKILMNEPKSLRGLGKDIGIATVTISSFLDGLKKTSFRETMKIESYILLKESEQDLNKDL